MKFEEVIDDVERLREILPFSDTAPAALKVSDRLNDVGRQFIELSPFIVVGTKDRDGLIDVTPKGDPAGFVKVLDDKTIAIPERLGNNRADGFLNILTDPNVAVTFIVPDHNFTLRIAGKARIVRDQFLSAQMTVNGKIPELALVVGIEEAFMHCSKSLIRSGIWRDDTWPERGSAPRLADWQVSIVDDGRTVDQVFAKQDHDEKTRMY
ncbi:MAG: pyridoxamine 5'-phosphate oxidase family protein [Rhizobiaceae bacterium]|nr:pyridoxamine 5'-phosphate oxidase family protein [Rhizobiaceae bacterium]